MQPAGRERSSAPAPTWPRPHPAWIGAGRARGHGGKAESCARGGRLRLDFRRNSCTEGWVRHWKRLWWSHIPGRVQKTSGWGTWECGLAGIGVGLGDLGGLFQPQHEPKHPLIYKSLALAMAGGRGHTKCHFPSLFCLERSSAKGHGGVTARAHTMPWAPPARQGTVEIPCLPSLPSANGDLSCS